MRRFVSRNPPISMLTRRLLCSHVGLPTAKPSLGQSPQAQQHGHGSSHPPSSMADLGGSRVVYSVVPEGDPLQTSSSPSLMSAASNAEASTSSSTFHDSVNDLRAGDPDKSDAVCNTSLDSRETTAKLSAADDVVATRADLLSTSIEPNHADHFPGFTVRPLSTAEESEINSPIAEPLSEGEATPPSGEPSSRVHLFGRNAVSVSNAQELFDELKVLGERQAFRSAGLLFGKALSTKDSDMVNFRVVRMALPILARLSWNKTISETLDFMEDKNMQVPVSVYNCAFAGIMRDGRADQIQRTIEQMWTMQSYSHPNATSYNYLIGAHFYRGNMEKAFSVLQEMKRRNVFPSLLTYHTLIVGCVRMSNPRRAFETLLAVEQQRFDMNALTLGQVMVACADADDHEAVTKLIARFDNALLRYTSEVEVFRHPRRRAEIDASSTTSDDGNREPKLEISGLMSLLHMAYRVGEPEIAEKAMAWFSEWYADADMPSSAWYCLIGAYACTGDFPEAFNAVSRMRSAGRKPSAADLHDALVKPLSSDLAKVDEQYYRLVDLINRSNSPTPADQTVVSDEGVGASAQHSSVVSDEVAGGSSQHSLQDNSEAQSEETGSESDSTEEGLLEGSRRLSLEDVMKYRKRYAPRLGDPESAASEAHVASVGIEEMNCIIAACSVAGDLERAFQTFDETQKQGLVANVDTFNALLLGCVTTRHGKGGMRIVEEMSDAKVSKNGETLYLLTRLYLRSGQFGQAVQAIEEATEEGIVLTSGTFQTLARKLSQVGDGMLLEKVVVLAERNGVTLEALYGRVEGKNRRWMHGAGGESGESNVEEEEEKDIDDEAGERPALYEEEDSDKDGGSSLTLESGEGRVEPSAISGKVLA